MLTAPRLVLTYIFSLGRSSNRFGFNTAISQLLTVPPYVFASASLPVPSLPSSLPPFPLPFSVLTCTLTPPCTNKTAATLLWWAVWSDRLKKRYPFVLAGLVYCLVGFAINIAAVGIGAKYFGTFLVVAGAYAGFPGVVAWCVSILA